MYVCNALLLPNAMFLPLLAYQGQNVTTTHGQKYYVNREKIITFHSPCFLWEVFAFFCALEGLLAILKWRQRV